MPFYPGHTLIVPKQHVVEVDELNDVVAKSVMDASKLIAKAIKIVYKPDGVTVCQNGGVFNELTHYHMHVVPRYKERSFAEFYMVQPGQKKNHNLEEIKTLLKEEIENTALKRRKRISLTPFSLHTYKTSFARIRKPSINSIGSKTFASFPSL